MDYKSLCSLINEAPQTGGRNRKLQMERIKRQYDIIQNGRNYEVIREYTPEEIKQIDTISKYSDYIKDSLIYYLSLVDDYKETITFYDIYEITKMVNVKYHKGKSNLNNDKWFYETHKFTAPPNELLGINGTDIIISDLFNFFSISKNLLKRNVLNAVESMKKKGLVDYYETFVLYREEIGFDGEPFTAHYICNEKDKTRIMDIKALGRESVGISNPQAVHYLPPEKRDEYYRFVLDKIEEEFGYTAYTDAIHFMLSKEALRIELKYNKSLQININVQNQLLDSAEMHKYIRQSLNEQFVNEYIKRC